MCICRSFYGYGVEGEAMKLRSQGHDFENCECESSTDMGNISTMDSNRTAAIHAR